MNNVKIIIKKKLYKREEKRLAKRWILILKKVFGKQLFVYLIKERFGKELKKK